MQLYSIETAAIEKHVDMDQAPSQRRIRGWTWAGLLLLFLELWVAKRAYNENAFYGWREFCGDVLTAPLGPCNASLVKIRAILLLTVGVIAWSFYRDLRRHPR